MDASQLFAETRFPDQGYEKWKALAEKALAGAKPDEALVSKTEDGIRIEPMPVRNAGAATWTRAEPNKPWMVTQRVDDPDPKRANRQAREDIEGGANGLSIVFEGAPNAFGYGLPATEESLNAALDGIPLDNTHLRIDVHPSSRASVDWLVALLTRRKIDPSKLSLAFGIDPAAIFAGTGRLRMSIEALQASMPQSLAHFFAMDIPGVLVEADGRVFHNAGATEAQELGIVIATAVAHLRMFEEARQPLFYAAPHIGFALSVDQDQFVSMAKIRALRQLWTRVQQACSIDASAGAVHVETSYRMLTYKDPETNILRSTIAAMAGALGGADSISILPHTYSHGLPEAFARRVARNVHSVLAGESHVDVVGDPAAGSGALEALTEGLCQKAWAEFQTIEAEGGMMESLLAGKLQARIAEARAARAATFSGAKRTIIGTTKYPAAQERPVTLLHADRRPMPRDGAVSCTPLPAKRIDETFGGAA